MEDTKNVPAVYEGRGDLIEGLPAYQERVRYGEMYRASTCLTLDMAINNARLLAKPDRDWLNP